MNNQQEEKTTLPPGPLRLRASTMLNAVAIPILAVGWVLVCFIFAIAAAILLVISVIMGTIWVIIKEGAALTVSIWQDVVFYWKYRKWF